LCRQYQAKLVIDNTFTTPCGLRPLQHGADLVVHSLTKFLAGHSDLTLGAVAGPAELIARVRKCARLWGASANPFESWLALRGITTLPLRWQRSCENALELASRLEAHPGILRVWYPGLASHPQHLLASRLLQKPGAMLAFEVEGAGPARELLRSLRHIRFAPSLGDVATTISYPVATSHRGIAETELLAQGITPGVLRLSVGIDHLEDIWDDLAQALNPARPR
jgi:cystathionine beta-lyase/cystathionine gamma-synthase